MHLHTRVLHPPKLSNKNLSGAGHSKVVAAISTAHLGNLEVGQGASSSIAVVIIITTASFDIGS